MVWAKAFCSILYGGRLLANGLRRLIRSLLPGKKRYRQLMEKQRSVSLFPARAKKRATTAVICVRSRPGRVGLVVLPIQAWYCMPCQTAALRYGIPIVITGALRMVSMFKTEQQRMCSVRQRFGTVCPARIIPGCVTVWFATGQAGRKKKAHR